MEGSLHRDLSLEEMAQAVNLSDSRLRHIFKAETGLSFAQYRKSLRMRRAKELIDTTFLSMKQIRSRVGAGDRSHFARDFKKINGLTPADYRRRHGGAKSG